MVDLRSISHNMGVKKYRLSCSQRHIRPVYHTARPKTQQAGQQGLVQYKGPPASKDKALHASFLWASHPNHTSFPHGPRIGKALTFPHEISGFLTRFKYEKRPRLDSAHEKATLRSLPFLLLSSSSAPPFSESFLSTVVERHV
jgi:hypothetical protein